MPGRLFNWQYIYGVMTSQDDGELEKFSKNFFTDSYVIIMDHHAALSSSKRLFPPPPQKKIIIIKWRRVIRFFFFNEKPKILFKSVNHSLILTVHFPRLRAVPHFSSGIVERAKRERAWKSTHARKGDTRRGERKMRDYRQSLWPFTTDWFWSVKFVSPSKSIKRIQWDSFPHWAVIALVIGKLRGIFIASKRKPRY